MYELAKVLLYYGLIYSTKEPEQKIVCPFHEDVNPSMIVNLKENAYFCFGCQCSGDALKFVQELERKRSGLNDLQGCKKYFEILKSDKFEKLEFHRFKKAKKQSRQLYNESYDYFHGLNKINWCSNELDDDVKEVRNYMNSRGFTNKTLCKIDARFTYNKNYPIVFPMKDNGKFRGWVCRTNDPETEKKRKYLYNEGFHRVDSLIGDYNNCEVLFLVEGYMDRLKFIQFEHNNCVAVLGWKMSVQHIEKIKQQPQIKIVVSALDNDKCGKKGSAFIKSVFPDKYVRFKYLKGIKDVGEMNREQFDKCYKKTMEEVKRKLRQIDGK